MSRPSEAQAALYIFDSPADLKVRRNPMKFSSLISVTALLLFATVSAFGQSETGSISGTVTDSSGAVVSGAQVTLTSVGTSATRATTTDSAGAYNITNLSPSLYELKVSSQGFGDFKQRFTISPGGHSSLDATLSARGTETVVEVTAHPETEVDTQTSSISQIVTSTRVSQLPSLTRNPYDFVRSTANARPAPTPCSTAVRTSTSTPQKSDRRFRSIRSRNLALTAITSRRNTDGLRVV